LYSTVVFYVVLSAHVVALFYFVGGQAINVVMAQWPSALTMAVFASYSSYNYVATEPYTGSYYD